MHALRKVGAEEVSDRLLSRVPSKTALNMDASVPWTTQLDAAGRMTRNTAAMRGSSRLIRSIRQVLKVE